MSVSMQKKRLGRGLDYWGIDKLATADGQHMVAVAELRPSRFNPRRNFSEDQLEFLDLPWEDACLSFHKTERAVQTASAVQVRKPLYRSSIARWKRYQDHLGRLKTALGPLADNS